MVANAVASEDAAGNIKPDRERSTDRIDGLAAWLDALVALAAGPVEEPPEPFAMWGPSPFGPDRW
jgi:phage terminase large subunit-like protein